MEPPIQCLLAPNPGPWTGSGTNSWLVGDGRLVLIDPGPDLPAHEAALLRAIAGRRVDAVIVTHAHRDHSALAPAIAARLGAPVLAAAEPHGGRALLPGLAPGSGVDGGFRPDQALQDGEILPFDGFALRVLHTPGHLGGHFCLALGDLLFSGDHVMGWSTSVVTPPEGDMAEYRASLTRLTREDWRRMLPGHGRAIETPMERLAELIAHRALREAQVLGALQPGPARAADLVGAIYPDLAPALQPAAAGNLLAHLLELQARGRVRPSDAAPLPQTRFGLAT